MSERLPRPFPRIATAFFGVHVVLASTSLSLLLLWVPLFDPLLAELGACLPEPTVLVLDASWALRTRPWIWFPILALASAADLVGLALLERHAGRVWLWLAGLGIACGLLAWNVLIPSSFYLIYLTSPSAVQQEMRELAFGGIIGGARF